MRCSGGNCDSADGGNESGLNTDGPPAADAAGAGCSGCITSEAADAPAPTPAPVARDDSGAGPVRLNSTAVLDRSALLW
jgi:hypothetical protein